MYPTNSKPIAPITFTHSRLIPRQPKPVRPLNHFDFFEVSIASLQRSGLLKHLLAELRPHCFVQDFTA
jgi:hypothetical protein